MNFSRRPLIGVRYLPASDPACPGQLHGNATAYTTKGCRCPEAREDWRLYNKRRREGRQPGAHIDATGTARRLQILAWHGYGWASIAPRLGASRRRVAELAIRRHPRVHRNTAAAVADLYDTLTRLPAPTGQAAAYARTVAKRNGWPPPAAWDDDSLDDPDARPCVAPELNEPLIDEVAVRLAVRGDSAVIARLTDAEREHAALRMLATGAGYTRVAAHLDLPERHARKLHAAFAARRDTAA